MNKLARPAALLCALAALSGCESPGVKAVICPGLTIRIHPDDRLTERTATRIERNNIERRSAKCSKRRKVTK